MSLARTVRSPDLQRLVDDGYEVEVDAGHLLVHNVPYVTGDKKIRRGTLVSELTLAGEQTARPSTHVAMFVGDHPCHVNGKKITQIENTSCNREVRPGLVVRHKFSNKPERGHYLDYHEKMTTYIRIISGPAQELDPAATAKTGQVIAATEGESVFRYMDTASSRAGINAVAAKLKGQRVGIIGLGGTGAYVLDLVAKTHVMEIHLFDGDDFLQHNAFRSPGAASLEELQKRPKKVAYYAGLYGEMRTGIVAHACKVDASNATLLDGLDFVFVCVDKGESRRVIMRELQARRIPFVDVGMGVQLVDELASLVGVLRVTMVTNEKHDHVGRRVPTDDGADDDYRENVQIADLNALNATLAVIKWKKHVKVYQDLQREHHSTYSLNVNLLTKDESTDAA